MGAMTTNSTATTSNSTITTSALSTTSAPSGPTTATGLTRPSAAPVSTTVRRSTTTPSEDRHRHTTPMLAELDREWERLRRRPQALRTASAWATDPVLDPFVTDVRDLDHLVQITQPNAIGGGMGDEILRCLIALAPAEELAGRIVLQRILPGLISRARSWDGRARSDVACDVVIGAAWVAIRTFDVRARSLHVAPALIADALWVGFRRGARKKVEQEIPVPDSVLMAQPAPPHEISPIEAFAGTLRAAHRAGVPGADLELMRRIVVDGTQSTAARNCAVTVRTIRNRRDSATWKIRRALGPDWADWTDPVVAA